MSSILDIFFNSAAGGGIIAALIWAFKLWYTRRLKLSRERRDHNHIEGMTGIYKVLEAEEELKETKEITRVVIFAVSNGGNQPVPGSTMYVSAIYPKHDLREQEKIILETYKMREIDDAYIDMVVQCAKTHKPFVMDLNNPKSVSDCMLKDIYNEEKIKYSEIYCIYVDGREEKTFIMSISTSEPNQRFDEMRIRAKINAKVAFIKQEFKKFRDAS